MRAARLEHVNITVSNPDRSAALFAKLCGWEVRWRGPALNDGYSIHLGNEDEYLALYSPGYMQAEPFRKGAPLQHVGLLVDDLDAAERVVIEEGLVPFSHGDYDPGRRFYFLDWDGIEFEMVSYS